MKVKLKREKVRNDILLRALPLIESGVYSKLTIRDLCEKIGITTGMFYRSFKSKSDLLAFFTLEQSKMLYEESEELLAGLTLREKLLQISLLSLQTLASTGPDSILMFIEIYNEQSTHSYQISRDMFHQQIRGAFAASCSEDKYSEDDVLRVTDCLFALGAGLCFEWYIRRSDPGYDFQAKSKTLLEQVIESLKLPDDE